MRSWSVRQGVFCCVAAVMAGLGSGTSPGSEKVAGSELPVYERIFIEDVRELALGPAPKYGTRGAYLDFEYRTIDGRLGEIRPGGELAARRHFYEIFFYILEGRGRTEVWLNESTPKQVVEWQKDSLFTVPLNAWYRIINQDPEKPVLYLAVSDEPFRQLLFDPDFVENNPFEFAAAWEKFVSLEYKHVDLRTWQGKAFHHLRSHPMERWAERGGSNAYFLSGNRTLNAHISEVPPQKAKKAHHHLNEAIIYILRGQGYTLLYQKEGDSPRKIEWKEGSLVAVPLDFWHQHHNTHPTEPARYLGLKNTPLMYKLIGRDTVHHHEPGYDKAY